MKRSLAFFQVFFRAFCGLLARFRRGHRGQGPAMSEAGQGTLEYILFLIITVILVLGIFYKFHRGFRTYAEAFFGGYIACLLETGELPGASAVCASEMKDFNSKSEKQLVKGSFGRGGAGNRRAPASQNQANRGRSGGGGGGGETMVGGRFARVGSLGDNNRPSVAKESGGSDSKSGAGSRGGAGGGGDVAVGRYRQNPGRRETIVMSSAMTDEQTKKKEESRPRAAAAGKAEESGDGLRPVKALDNTSEGKKYNAPSTGQGFSVSGLIKILIIILLVVAMVVFFGGQLLQISKSREKGGD